MNEHDGTCPLSQQQLVDEFFIEHRAEILSIAAFLDRLDRAAVKDAGDEFRVQAFRKALEVLLSDEPGRAERVQMILSDPRTDLLDERDRQDASGAYDDLATETTETADELH